MVIWLWTYGKGPMRSDRKPAATTSWATGSNQQQGIFYMHYPTDRIVHIKVFVQPVVVHWLEQEIAKWVQHEESTRQPIIPWMHQYVVGFKNKSHSFYQ